MYKHSNTSGSLLLILSNIFKYSPGRIIYIIFPSQYASSSHIPLTAARTNIPFQGDKACLFVVIEHKALHEVSGCKGSLTDPKSTSRYLCQALKSQSSANYHKSLFQSEVKVIYDDTSIVQYIFNLYANFILLPTCRI